jgi:hypothetical protein
LKPLSPCGRGVGERGCQRIEDGQQDALFIVEDVVVPEAEDAEALAGQICVSPSVGVIAMLASIHLHDQAVPQTREIDDIAVDWELPLELVAG